MGKRGPAPKRADQRLGHRAKDDPAKTAIRSGEAIVCAVPDPGDWSVGVKQWYLSLAQSGQSVWYSAGDWSSAWLMAEAMNAELVSDGVLKSATLSAWLKLNAALLVTEGDRRRAAVELSPPAPVDDSPPSDVTDIRSWRESLNG